MFNIITFSDSIFNDSDWELVPWMSGNGGTTAAKQEVSGGNPGTFRSIVNHVNTAAVDNSNIFGFNFRRGASYNPSKQGAIASINYSEDSILIEGFGEGQATGPALKQNGKLFFTAPPNSLIIPNNIWATQEKLNLQAEDFRTPESPDEHPDFSIYGSIIEFGFFRANTATLNGYAIAAGIDNWYISIIPTIQARPYDAVKGGETPPPTNAVVLGGLDRVKKLLASNILEQQITALNEALKYGQPGLDLAFKVLKEESQPLHKEAYRVLLKKIEYPNVMQALREYNCYRFFDCLQTLGGHPHSGIASVAISADGQTIVSGGAYPDNTIKVWDLSTKREVRTIKAHSHIVSSLLLSPDGKTLVSCSHDTTIKVWNVRTGREIRTFKAASAVDAIAISRDWQILAAGSYDCTVKIWNLQTGEELGILKGHAGTITSVALSADGNTLFSGSGDSTIKVWDVKSGREIYTLKGHASSVSCIALSSDRNTLFSGSHRTIKIWDVKKQREIGTLNGHTGYILGLACSADGQTLFSGGNYDDKKIKIWNWQTRQHIRTLEGHPSGVCFALSGDGQTLVSGSYNVEVWGMG